MSKLETLKEDLLAKKWREIAEDIIKYQDFKVSAAIKKMRCTGSDTTKKNYIVQGRHYLKTGSVYGSCRMGSSLFNYIDEALARHVQPLTPSEIERARDMKPRKINYTKKEIMPPITKLGIVKKPVTSKIEYGVRLDDNICLLKNENEANIFLRGVKFAGGNAKIITVEIGEI